MSMLFALSILGWTGSVASPAMLWMLAAMAIPVAIHLLSRRRTTVVDWGAMQFLELGRRAQRKFQWSEWLLMAGRMGLLGLVALAAARPLFGPSNPGAEVPQAAQAPGAGVASGEPRDLVLILDGSESMGHKKGETTYRQRAIDWSRALVKRLPDGSAVAVLDARELVRPLVDPLNYDKGRVDEALAYAAEPRGGSDLAAAISEAFRVLETGRNSRRDVVVVSDGQRSAWRPGESTRWALLHDLYTSAKGAGRPVPDIWVALLDDSTNAQADDAGLTPLVLDRGLVPVGLPLSIRTSVKNSGKTDTGRTAELYVDGVPVPGSSQRVDPIPAQGQTPIRFETILKTPGSHRLSVRLQSAEDSLAANDQSEATVESAEGLPVLLVDGTPGQAAFQGPTDFLRAALTPAEDAAPAVRARTLPLQRFGADTVSDARVIVLASVSRLDASQREAVEKVLAGGGGVLIVPGEAIDPKFYAAEELLAKNGWLPAALGPAQGQLASRRGNPEAVAHLDPASFTGAVMPAFGGGDDPPLARAGLFWYRRLEPVSDAVVLARLDSGDPWLIERTVGPGRALMVAGSLDARGGTLPANPDFVPWLHTLIFHLAEPGSATRVFQPGEAIRVELNEPASGSGPEVTVRSPDGREVPGEWLARGGVGSEIRFRDSAEPGIYQIDLPSTIRRPGPVFVQVGSDPREAEIGRLDDAESSRLAEGWPMHVGSNPEALADQILSVPGGGTRPIWRWLLLLALLGLCLEVLATRRLALSRGLAAVDTSTGGGRS